MPREESLASVVPARVVGFCCERDLKYRNVWCSATLAANWEGAADEDLFPEGAAARLVAAKREALAHGRATHLLEQLSLDAEVVPCAVYLMPAGGMLRGLVLDLGQIARLIEERNLMRHLSDVSSDHGYVVKIDRNGGIDLEWTAAGLYQSTGYTLDDLRERGGWPILIHPDDISLLMQEIENVVRGKTYINEFRVVTKSGAVRWIGNRAKVLPGYPDAREMRLLGAARDITDHKHAEEAARRLQDELAHVTRVSTLGEMASGIAHELNQPLAAIINHADACAMALAAVADVPDHARRDLEQIAVQAERAADIIRRLRGLVVKRDPRQEQVDVNRCVHDVVGLLSAVARRRGVRIAVDLGAPPPVLADPVLVQQVVLNLVQNAFDAVAGMHESRREVSICTRASAAGAEVSVRDTGESPGPRVLERIFEPFYTTKPEGLGMGLTISRSIVESHGGRLEAEVVPQGGMRFWFILPERGGR